LFPFEAFSTDSAQATAAACIGCVGGTQCENLSATGLSCARTSCAVTNPSASAAITPHQADFMRFLPRCCLVESRLRPGLAKCIQITIARYSGRRGMTGGKYGFAHHCVAFGRAAAHHSVALAGAAVRVRGNLRDQSPPVARAGA